MQITPKPIISPKICIDWLTYRSYATQREICPDRPAEDWSKLYAHQEVYEKIYQMEKRNEKT